MLGHPLFLPQTQHTIKAGLGILGQNTGSVQGQGPLSNQGQVGGRSKIKAEQTYEYMRGYLFYKSWSSLA